eukprot:gnl/MRDRNA2_/MRDRNA2_191246_c0_seq1.p2 gnl/MRDRNA2_/MRDRNA2_191246_c0~~gnl/MRDRNA2_/MRDRNA2_191246_c0_seq1.p2  ORF type:complete len:102 (+),score=15.81 gnl/MRDRNA2_/MRDRNA2_191246_c0_seq1:113-418(+)
MPKEQELVDYLGMASPSAETSTIVTARPNSTKRQKPLAVHGKFRSQCLKLLEVSMSTRISNALQCCGQKPQSHSAEQGNRCGFQVKGFQDRGLHKAIILEC